MDGMAYRPLRTFALPNPSYVYHESVNKSMRFSAHPPLGILLYPPMPNLMNPMSAASCASYPCFVDSPKHRSVPSPKLIKRKSRQRRNAPLSAAYGLRVSGRRRQTVLCRFFPRIEAAGFLTGCASCSRFSPPAKPAV